MNKNIDLLTGEKIPKKLSSIEERLSALGLDDKSLIEKVNYLEKELEISFKKNYRLEKEAIILKKENLNLKKALNDSLKIDFNI
jgi:hypothetical protein